MGSMVFMIKGMMEMTTTEIMMIQILMEKDF